MKRFLITLMVLLLIFTVVPAIAQTKQVTVDFQWEQGVIDTIDDNFYGWKVFYGTNPGGPYSQLGADIVYDGNPLPNYIASEDVIAPDNAETTYYFVVNAWDKQGNFSADSNEVSVTVDFLPPGTPINFSVTIRSP